LAVTSSAYGGRAEAVLACVRYPPDVDIIQENCHLFPVAISGSHLSRVQANRLFCSCNAYSPGTQCGALFPEKVQKVRLEDGTKNKVHFVTQFPGTNPPAGA